MQDSDRWSDPLPAWLWRPLAVLVLLSCCAAVVLGYWIAGGPALALLWRLAPRRFRES